MASYVKNTNFADVNIYYQHSDNEENTKDGFYRRYVAYPGRLWQLQ